MIAGRFLEEMLKASKSFTMTMNSPVHMSPSLADQHPAVFYWDWMFGSIEY